MKSVASRASVAGSVDSADAAILVSDAHSVQHGSSHVHSAAVSSRERSGSNPGNANDMLPSAREPSAPSFEGSDGRPVVIEAWSAAGSTAAKSSRVGSLSSHGEMQTGVLAPTSTTERLSTAPDHNI